MDIYAAALGILRGEVSTAFQKQYHFNKAICLFCVASTVGIISMRNRINDQAKQIKELRAEIEELNNQKGE